MNDTLDTAAGTLVTRVRAVVEEALEGSDLYLVDLVVRGQKGSRVVEVYLDSDAPLTVDTLGRMNREIGFLLDVEDVIDGKYNLNVSSPGVDRPLKMPRQYRKNIGRTLVLRYRPTPDEEKTIKGVLEEMEAEGICLREGKRHFRIPFADILDARVALPW